MAADDGHFAAWRCRQVQRMFAYRLAQCCEGVEDGEVRIEQQIRTSGPLGLGHAHLLHNNTADVRKQRVWPLVGHFSFQPFLHQKSP